MTRPIIPVNVCRAYQSIFFRQAWMWSPKPGCMQISLTTTAILFRWMTRIAATRRHIIWQLQDWGSKEFLQRDFHSMFTAPRIIYSMLSIAWATISMPLEEDFTMRRPKEILLWALAWGIYGDQDVADRKRNNPRSLSLFINSRTAEHRNTINA